MTSSPEYVSWCKMKRRCSDETGDQWKDYGGRGISICQRWQDFQAFILDMGLMPEKGYTLERKDNSGNYEPGNCVWATRKEQGRNRRDNHLVEYQGHNLTIAEWAELTGLRHEVIWDRLNRGWPVEDALLLPSKRGVRCAKH